MPKINIPYTCTVNSKVYFGGEVELPDKEAEAVQAFLKTVPEGNTDPVTDSPLPASKEDKKATKSGSSEEE